MNSTAHTAKEDDWRSAVRAFRENRNIGIAARSALVRVTPVSLPTSHLDRRGLSAPFCLPT